MTQAHKNFINGKFIDSGNADGKHGLYEYTQTLMVYLQS